MSLAELAAHSHTVPSTILRLTAEHSPGAAFPKNVSDYINGVFKGAIPPRRPHARRAAPLLAFLIRHLAAAAGRTYAWL